MGPLQNLVEMIPGMGKQLKGIKVDESGLKRIEAIIQSMTVKERVQPHIIDGSRRRRIADGSGTSVQEVNQLLKQFVAMQKMIKNISRMSLPKGFPM